jgi:hypothetical protein
MNTFSNWNWILKFESEIKRGHFSRIWEFRNYFKFYNFGIQTIFKLCLYFEIGFGDENGSNLKFASFQNYSKFFTEILKTQNTKLVALEKIYKLCFKRFPKFFLDLELFKKGVKQGFGFFRVFGRISN